MYDIKNLVKLKRLDDKIPEAMRAFWAFDKAAFAPGAIDAQQTTHGCGCRSYYAVSILYRIPREICPGCGDHSCYSFVPGLTSSTEQVLDHSRSTKNCKR